MSNRRNERLPEVIYVRRRIAAVVVILVLVALVVWGLVSFAGRGSEEVEPTPEVTTGAEATPASEETEATRPAEETDEPSPAAEETETTAESEEGSGDSGTSRASETTRAAEATEPKDSCELRDLRITATSDRPGYSEGARPTFYMTVDNPTAADCEIDLDDSTLRFEVYDLASNQRMWADTDCFPSVETGTRTFPAGEERHFEAVWSRMDSRPDQCTNRQQVPAGAYYLHAVIGDNPSDAHTFNLG